MRHRRPAVVAETAERARDTGVSAIWRLANTCYTGMRAQDSDNAAGRVLAFVVGLPGALLTWLVVRDGSERVRRGAGARCAGDRLAGDR